MMNTNNDKRASIIIPSNFEGKKKKTNMKYIDKKEKEKREAFTCVHTFIKAINYLII